MKTKTLDLSCENVCFEYIKELSEDLKNNTIKIDNLD